MRLPPVAKDHEIAAYLRWKFPKAISDFYDNLNYNTNVVSTEVKTIRSQGGDFGPQSLNAFIKIMKGSRMLLIRELENYLSEGRKVNCGLMESLLQSLAIRGDIANMNKYFKLMKLHSVKCKAEHASSVIQLFSNRGDTKRVLQTLASMRKPNFNCYKYAMKGCSSVRDAKGVLTLFFTNSKLVTTPGEQCALICLLIRKCTKLSEIRNIFERHGKILASGNKARVELALLVYHSKCSNWRRFNDFLNKLVFKTGLSLIDIVIPFFDAIENQLSYEVRVTSDISKINSFTALAEGFICSIFHHGQLKHSHIMRLLQIYNLTRNRQGAASFLKWLLSLYTFGISSNMMNEFNAIPGPFSTARQSRFE